MPTIRPNPFSPDARIKDPQKFAGRTKDVRTAFRKLARNRHLMLAGEKGIGKSSITEQLKLLFAGVEEARDRFAVSDLDSGTHRRLLYLANTSPDPNRLLARIATELADAVGVRSDAEKVIRTTQLGIKSVLMTERRVEQTEQFKKDPLDVFVAFLIELRQRVVPFRSDGVIIAIDEIDGAIAGNPAWGPWFKSLIETLQNHDIDNVVFLLLGTHQSYHDLLKQHPSLQRMIEPIVVDVMSAHEIIDLCNLALDGTRVFFHAQTLRYIQRLASGRPYSAHLIGEALYDRAIEEDLVYNEEPARPSVVDLMAKDSDRRDHDAESEQPRERAGPRDVMPYMLSDVIRELVARIYSREYAEFLRAVSHPSVNEVVKGAAALDQQSFGVDHLIAITGFDAGKICEAVHALAQCGTFRQFEVDSWEFSDPLFRLKLRLVAEAHRLEAAILKTKQRLPTTKPNSESVQKPTPVDAAERDRREALLADYLVDRYVERKSQGNSPDSKSESQE